MKKNIYIYAAIFIFIVISGCGKEEDFPPLDIRNFNLHSISKALNYASSDDISSHISAVIEDGIQNNINNNKEIYESLSSLEKEMASDDSQQGYGGELGKKYFKIYTNYIIIPTLDVFVKNIAELISNNNIKIEDKYIGIFSGIIEWAGKKRNEIARNARAKSYENFGTAPENGTLLEEPIQYNSFPAWNKEIRKNLSHEFLRDKIFLEALKESEKNKKNNIQEINYKKDGLDITIKGNYSKLKISIAGEPNRLSTYMIIHLNFSKSNLDNIFFNEDASEIKIRHHAKFAPENSWISEEVSKAARYFKNILLLKPGTDAQKLKEELAYLFRWINISSTYLRGQAAISEWLIKSFAQSKEFTIQFSEFWTGPKSPNPDQHSLSIQNFEHYLKAFNENVFLKP